MAEPCLQLEDFICLSIYATGHAFNRLYSQWLKPLGLTYPQYLAMVALWNQDGQTVKSLGEKLSLESSTLTPLLKRLEALELIRRTRDTQDERQVRLRLTARGHSLRAQAEGIPACVVEAAGLGPAELARLQREIDALRRALLAHGGRSQAGG